jgi:ATP-dependent helicase HrpA
LPRLFPLALELKTLLGDALAGLQRVRAAIAALAGRGYADTLEDIEEQLAGLYRPDFLLRTSPARLRSYARYAEAMCERLQKLEQDPRRDYARLDELRPFVAANRALAGLGEPYAGLAAVEQYRWMLEEYRVSLFAQGLGTAGPVSPKRLRKQWQLAREALAAAGVETARLASLPRP